MSERYDIAIPIVFPDYLISVATPVATIDFPDFSGLQDLKIPSFKSKLPYLGHAGILFINGHTGRTRYYEYGRYDPAAKGLTRKQTVPDVRIGKGGLPTAASVKITLTRIATLAGQGGRITGAWIALPTGGFGKMGGKAAARIAENVQKDREAYDLLSHSCLHFMKDVAESGGAQMPMVIDPRPAGYMDRVRGDFPDLDFNKPNTLTIEGIILP